MDDKYISSVHLQKLEHRILEIRERALHGIISKLDRGFLYDNDLARTKEIILKLFKWFSLKPLTNEESVLYLIKRMLLTESGKIVINQYGIQSIISELQKIRECINQQHRHLVDDIMNDVKDQLVPPFDCSRPLSYRSDVSNLIDVNNVPSEITMHFDTSPQISAKSVTVVDDEGKSSNTGSDVHLHHYTMKWFYLISSDEHVLESVENSLRNSSEPLKLLHSCEFFNDVLLYDFPAEVFLQKPTIVMLLQNLLKTSSSNRIVNIILGSLLKLTRFLQIRICSYSDPNMYSNVSSELCVQSRSSKTSLSNEENSEKGSIRNLNIKQISLPEYCLEMMECVFVYLQQTKSRKLDESNVNTNKKQHSLNIALQLLRKLINLLCTCVTKELWNNNNGSFSWQISSHFQKMFIRYGDTLEYFRAETMLNDFDPSLASMYLKLMYVSVELLNKLIPLEKAHDVLPCSFKNALGNALLNSALTVGHNGLHKFILEYVETFGEPFDKTSLEKSKSIRAVNKSIRSAVKYLKNGSGLPVAESINLVRKGILSLEIHKSATFMKNFVDLCSNRLPTQLDNNNSESVINESILLLLAHKQVALREHMYKLCHVKVVDAVGPKLNMAKISAPGSRIQFLLNSEIFVEIAQYGLRSENVKIQGYADSILIHLLKCKILVSDDIWYKTVEALITSLPILLCHTNKTSSLGRTLLGILDPDTAKCLHLKKLEVIKGNIEILFASDDQARNEAASRLCWLLASEESTSNMLPRLNNLNDKMLGNACQIRYVLDLNRNRHSQNFYQASSLKQVLEVLNSPNTEPVVRRSALTQVNVMMEDYLLHRIFLQNNGLPLILKIMKRSLIEEDYRDYPDSIVPAISILKNMCVYNSGVRRELSSNIEVYYLTLRGLFLFLTEEHVKQDASTLLFLLIFNDSVEGCASQGNLSLPLLVHDNLNVPFTCNTHGKTSKYTREDQSEILFGDKSCTVALQICWATEWAGKVKNVLDEKKIEKGEIRDFDKRLELSDYALHLLKSSNLEYCVEKYLMAIQNCTSHKNAIETVNKLSGCLQLYDVAEQTFNWKCDSLFNLPWESTFSKFLTVLPSSEEDVLLLTYMVKFLAVLVPLYKSLDTSCWVLRILKDSNSCLLDLLQTEATPETSTKTLIQELLHLVVVCVNQERVIDYCVADLYPSKTASCWSNFIETIIENLRLSNTQHFYNLAYLDCLLSALVHLTGTLGWSNSKSGASPREPIRQLMHGLCELVGTFHCGKGPDACMSVMGLSITRNVLLILNHLVAELQHCNSKSWELCFFNNDDDEENIMDVFYQLWSSRDIVLKAAVLQLFAGLCKQPKAAMEITKGVGRNKMNIWENALMIFLDTDEASVVRENAALFLTNLCSNFVTGNTENLSQPMIMDQPTFKNGNSFGAVLNLLQSLNFYKELSKILPYLYNKSKLNEPVSENGMTEEVNSDSLALKDDEEYLDTTIVVTPGVVKSIAFFLCNVLTISSEDITSNLQEHGLIRLFFKCLSCPQAKITDSRELALYRDILEMNTAVCLLLNKIVSNSQFCVRSILHMQDSLNYMLSLLNANVYYTDFPELVFLRNKLWAEIYRLIAAFVEYGNDVCENVKNLIHDSFAIITNCISQCGKHSFLRSLCESISTNQSDELQQNALTMLTLLLKVDTICMYDRNIKNVCSLQDMLDTTDATCVTFHIRDEIEEGYINTNFKELENAKNRSSKEMMGAKLCKILLDLYELVTLKNVTTSSAKHKRQIVVVNALTEILCVSKTAKVYAFQHGLHAVLIQQLVDVHVKLSLESVECLKRVTDKKRVCPVLKEMESLIGLLTNFMVRSFDVKCALRDLGLPNLIHKLWVWCNIQKSYIIDALRLICTFTTDCLPACQSLILTSCVAGAGFRKSPSNMSLLHAIIVVISKEMEQISRTHDLTVLQLCFRALHNSCAALECRLAISKSNLLQCVSRLHPAISKHQKPWENVEVIWLEFLHTFTIYPEGQTCIAKIPDVLELIITLASSTNKEAALSVLRNVAFHQPNRPRLLTSCDFINILKTKLLHGNNKERNDVIGIMWALAANNQKGKLVLKCAQLDLILKEFLKRCTISHDLKVTSANIEQMKIVFNLLNDNDKYTV